MGQKIHPIGFRVGVSRKWNSSWFASDLEWKKLFFYQREVENFFRFLFHYYSYTKISKRKRVLLFDVKLFKYSLQKIFIFVFFYKLRTKRRKETRPVLKAMKRVLKPWENKQNMVVSKDKLNFWSKKGFFYRLSTINFLQGSKKKRNKIKK